MYTDHRHSPGRFSRATIETLCILDAVGTSGATARALTTRLGLSPTLTQAIGEGLQSLVMRDLLSHDQTEKLTLTDAGRELLGSVT